MNMPKHFEMGKQLWPLVPITEIEKNFPWIGKLLWPHHKSLRDAYEDGVMTIPDNGDILKVWADAERLQEVAEEIFIRHKTNKIVCFSVDGTVTATFNKDGGADVKTSKNKTAYICFAEQVLARRKLFIFSLLRDEAA